MYRVDSNTQALPYQRKFLWVHFVSIWDGSFLADSKELLVLASYCQLVPTKKLWDVRFYKGHAGLKRVLSLPVIFFFFHRSIDLRKLIFTSNSITESTGFKFFSNNIPRVRFCSVILENKNVADVFQRFPLNANANLNSNFSFLFFYCIFLIIYFFFSCIYRLPLF